MAVPRQPLSAGRIRFPEAWRCTAVAGSRCRAGHAPMHPCRWSRISLRTAQTRPRPCDCRSVFFWSMRAGIGVRTLTFVSPHRPQPGPAAAQALARRPPRAAPHRSTGPGPPRGASALESTRSRFWDPGSGPSHSGPGRRGGHSAPTACGELGRATASSTQSRMATSKSGPRPGCPAPRAAPRPRRPSRPQQPPLRRTLEDARGHTVRATRARNRSQPHRVRVGEGGREL